MFVSFKIFKFIYGQNLIILKILIFFKLVFQGKFIIIRWYLLKITNGTCLNNFYVLNTFQYKLALEWMLIQKMSKKEKKIFSQMQKRYAFELLRNKFVLGSSNL